MARNGSRPVTETLLEAHLQPMRDDIRQLVHDQREFAQFMTGAVSSAALQDNIRRRALLDRGRRLHDVDCVRRADRAAHGALSYYAVLTSRKSRRRPVRAPV